MTGTIQPILSADQKARRWRDLSFLRVTIGLVTAPAIANVVAMSLTYAALVLFMPWDDWRFTVKDAEVSEMTIMWWFIVCLTYLLLVTRRIGRIARYECLLVGAAAAAIAPLGLAFPWSILYRAEFIGVGAAIDYMWADMKSNVQYTIFFMMMLALLLVPFGALSGWIFWHISIRPATTRIGDAAPVFE